MKPKPIFFKQVKREKDGSTNNHIFSINSKDLVFIDGDDCPVLPNSLKNARLNLEALERCLVVLRLIKHNFVNEREDNEISKAIIFAEDQILKSRKEI